MSLALLFPGQGSQRPGMVRALSGWPAVADTWREARSVLDSMGLADVLDDGRPLRRTTEVQIGLLLVGVASARALTHGDRPPPTFVAGHSAGGYAAAVVAGVLTLPEALEALHLRGTLMEQACAGRDWGMAALTGLPVRSAERLVAEVASPSEPLWVANVNSATQIVLGGTEAALVAAAAAASARGARACERLDVPVASHGPVQAGTAEQLARHLGALTLRAPVARYLTNVGGRAVSTAEDVLDDLARSVAHPVRWYDATRLMGELGVTKAVEAAPGHVLTRLWSSAVPRVRCVALADAGLAVAR